MTLAVLALDADGRGVARNPDGKVVFVEGALAGEIVEARLVRSRRSFDLMRATAVLQESSGRRAPRCAYFGVCGGCATQHADARTQVAAKQRGLEDCLQRIGKVEPGCILAPIHGEEWGYRRRARLSVRYLVGKGVAMVGFRERRSTFVADMDTCEVLPPRVAALIPGLRPLVASLSIRDRLPQIEVAVGDDAVALVFRHLLPLTAADEAALRDFAQQTGVRVWLQPGGPDSAHPFAPESGPALHYTLPEFGVRIEFRPTDFTQVNHGVNRLLVARAVRLLDPQPGERIADLFCGLGNFALPMARGGAQVTGFEGSAGLAERARQNAALNGLDVRFESADLARHGIGAFGPFDKLLLDPPREGAVELIKALPPGWPRRIVYVSCDPATLARDAGVLVHVQGFALSAAGVVNMFPHTAHVESIALFER
ncbi:MAG: 23S rRNA (uracil(1939)-C(5))-methyltransferase RlmD [Betaproteobacteria bacterium]|nr:MAG: 23S rRNA (uracil(1939)-C(5))-methyltransferase RlmD [Betaproteobacteria bacterium]